MPQQWHWFLARRYISFGLQQIKLDENSKAHENSDKVLSGTGSKTYWQQRNCKWKFAWLLKENWIAAALLPLASHAVVFRGVVFQTPLKTTAWEAMLPRVWPVSSKVALLMMYETTPDKKKVPANRDRTNKDLICKNRQLIFLCSVICCCMWLCKCFMAALLSDMKRLLWRSWDVDFTNQGMGGHFFLFLEWKIAGKGGQSAGCHR